MYSYLDRGKPGANKPPYPLTLVCHSYSCCLFSSSLYTSLKRVRFFSILQTHYGCLCQQCNQSEHLSLARQKTCPPRGLCETLNFTTLANAPLLQSDIGIITELLRWLFCFSFHSVGSIGPGATWSSKLMGLSVSLVLSLVRVVAVVNSFDSGTLNPVCWTFKSSLDNCRSIEWKGFVHLSSRNTFYNHREVIFSQYTKSKETIAVLLKVLSKILREEFAILFLIFQRFILFYLPFLLLFFSNRQCTSLNYWY